MNRILEEQRRLCGIQETSDYPSYDDKSAAADDDELWVQQISASGDFDEYGTHMKDLEKVSHGISSQTNEVEEVFRFIENARKNSPDAYEPAKPEIDEMIKILRKTHTTLEDCFDKVQDLQQTLSKKISLKIKKAGLEGWKKWKAEKEQK